MESLSATSAEGVLLDLCGVSILLLSFACLGSKLFDRYVAYYGMQSAVLALAAGVVAYHLGEIDLWVLAVLTLVMKAIGIPTVTRRLLLTRLDLKRDASLAIGLSTSLIVGAVLTAFAYLALGPGVLPAGAVAVAVIQLSMAVVLLGGLAMVVRRHTIAQLFGWLIVENGVFLAAITLVATFPFIVEAGIFLDLVAAVLIMLALVSGIVHRLAGASATELRGLRE